MVVGIGRFFPKDLPLSPGPQDAGSNNHPDLCGSIFKEGNLEVNLEKCHWNHRWVGGGSSKQYRFGAGDFCGKSVGLHPVVDDENFGASQTSPHTGSVSWEQFGMDSFTNVRTPNPFP